MREAHAPSLGERLQKHAKALFKQGIQFCGGRLSQTVGRETALALERRQGLDDGTQAWGAQGGGVALAGGDLRAAVEPRSFRGSHL